MKKKSELSRKLSKTLHDAVSEDLEVYDIHEWKKACRSFAPISYAVHTRKQWLKTNRYRIEAAREIVEFVDSWVTHFRNREDFKGYTVAALQEEVIQVIRKAQQKIASEKGVLNSVKLNGFKSLIRWADNPKQLENGPYGGSDTIPEGITRIKRSRSLSRNKLASPKVNLVKDFVLVEKNLINLVLSIINKSRFPFQNVEIELRLDENLSVNSVEPYTWSPRDRRIRIGFIEAALVHSCHEVEINVRMTCKKRVEAYTVGGLLLFDDLPHRVRAEIDIEDEVISF